MITNRYVAHFAPESGGFLFRCKGRREGCNHTPSNAPVADKQKDSLAGCLRLRSSGR